MTFSNVYEYLLYENGDIPSVLKACVPEDYAVRQHSDYENFHILCRCMPMLSGQKLFSDIHLSVKKLYDEDIDLNLSSCDILWRKFYEDRPFTKGAENILTVKYIPYSDIPCATDICDISSFVRPDKYHSELIRKKIARGENIDSCERSMITIQNIRETAQFCLEKSEFLVLDASRLTADTLVKTVEYLDTSDLLPKTFILNSKADKELLNLLHYPNIFIGVQIQKSYDNISDIASCIPIGRVILVDDGETEMLSSALNKNLSVWQKEGTAYTQCKIELEKYNF